VRIWSELLGAEVAAPFRRMTWDEAALRYGTDKPDLRFGAEISDVTDLLAATEFKAFRGVVDGGGVVRGLAVPGAMEFSRKDFDDLVEFAKGWGGKGVALAAAAGRWRDPLPDREIPLTGRAGRHHRALRRGRGRHHLPGGRRGGGGGAGAGAAAAAPRRAPGLIADELAVRVGDRLPHVRVAAR
jgi:hypothetical protein